MLGTTLATIGLAAVILQAAVLALRWSANGHLPWAGMAAGLALALTAPLLVVIGHAFTAAAITGLAGAVLFGAGLMAQEKRKKKARDDS